MPVEEFTFEECERLLEGLKSLVDSIKVSGFQDSLMDTLFSEPGKSVTEKIAEMAKTRREADLKSEQIEESMLALRLKLVRLRNRLSEHRS